MDITTMLQLDWLRISGSSLVIRRLTPTAEQHLKHHPNNVPLKCVVIVIIVNMYTQSCVNLILPHVKTNIHLQVNCCNKETTQIKRIQIPVSWKEIF